MKIYLHMFQDAYIKVRLLGKTLFGSFLYMVEDADF